MLERLGGDGGVEAAGRGETQARVLVPGAELGWGGCRSRRGGGGEQQLGFQRARKHASQLPQPPLTESLSVHVVLPATVVAEAQRGRAGPGEGMLRSGVVAEAGGEPGAQGRGPRCRAGAPPGTGSGSG